MSNLLCTCGAPIADWNEAKRHIIDSREGYHEVAALGTHTTFEERRADLVEVLGEVAADLRMLGGNSLAARADWLAKDILESLTVPDDREDTPE